MIELLENHPLDGLNTFGFPSVAARYAEAANDDDLIALLKQADAMGLEPLILGGGSNVVLTGDLPHFVIRLTTASVTMTDPDPNGAVQVTADAGLDWHGFVEQTLDLGLSGLENLSLIPGTVGAAPVQNIGAYGVELDQRLSSVRAWHRPSAGWLELDAAECAFEYRNSRFKRERGDWVITSVTFDLGHHLAVTYGYRALADELADHGIQNPTARDIADAVIAVRRAKLPDPAELGNAGSFFHNPVVTTAEADAIAARFPALVRYPQADGRVKLAAGWLIDQLGFRGYTENGVGVHDRQALVLVNTGDGTGRALMTLAEKITTAVAEQYGVTLTVEPLVL